MTWIATFQCLSCSHPWWEPAPADAWEMAIKVAAAAACPLCGAQMREGQVELLNHFEQEIPALISSPYNFNQSSKD